jgi:hypothetical protein
MEKEQALALMLSEWLEIPESERTDSRAACFAMKMISQRPELEFDTIGDPYQDIKSRLNRYLSGWPSRWRFVSFLPTSLN